MEITLAPEIQEFAEQKVARGEYNSVSELMNTVLRQLQTQEIEEGWTQEELRQIIAQADAQFERGECKSYDAASLKVRLEQIKTEGQKRMAVQEKASL